jgi:hypothetical protein
MKRGTRISQSWSITNLFTVIVDQTGLSALLAAVRGGLHSVAALLLDRKADPNVVDNVIPSSLIAEIDGGVMNKCIG